MILAIFALAFSSLGAPTVGVWEEDLRVVPNGWGVNLGFAPFRPEEAGLFRQLGTRWVRRDLFWHEIEKEKGKYHFEKYDQFLSDVEAMGLRVVFILDYGNDLYQKGAPTTPEARAGFVEYMRQVVGRYKDKGVLWELWNEPNGEYWQPKPDVEAYVALAREVGAAFDKDFPNERIAMPALAGVDLPFLESCLSAGLMEHFDALTIHPYRPMEPESVETDYAKVRALLSRYAADREIEIYSGEWGYAGGKTIVSDETQGDYFVRQYLTNLALSVPMSIWYNWYDNGVDKSQIINNYGVLDENLVPKPAFRAGRDLVRELAGYRFVKRLDASLGRWLLVFEKDGHGKEVEWSAKGDQSAPIVREIHDAAWLASVVAAPSLPPSLAVTSSSELAEALRPLAEWSDANDGILRVQKRQVRDFDELGEVLGELGFGRDRSDRSSRLFVEVKLPEIAPIEQTTLVVPKAPLRLSLQPTGANALIAQVIAPYEGFEGSLRIETGGMRLEREVSVEKGSTQRIWFETEKPILDEVRAELVSKEGEVVARIPPGKFVPLEWVGDKPLLELESGGDEKRQVTFSLSAKAPPPGLPSPPAKALSLIYEAKPGWCYVEAKPLESKPIEGKPMALGVWVCGDASGALLRMRYEDASGQVWQPDGGALDFVGWKFVTFSLAGDAEGRWGGANDGILYPPIRIETAFLLDSPGGRGMKGEVYFASPVLFLESKEGF